MKKGLIFAAVLAAFAVVFFAITSFFGGQQGTTCETFINAIRNNDANASYALLSENAKSTTTQEDWEARVSELYSAYADPEKPALKLKERKVTEAGDSGEDEVSEAYIIANGSSRYLGTCSLIQTENGILIDGFHSKADLDPADYQ